MTSVFHQLLQTEAFVDVTLACNEASLKAHKVSFYWTILSSIDLLCIYVFFSFPSFYFRTFFSFFNYFLSLSSEFFFLFHFLMPFSSVSPRFFYFSFSRYIPIQIAKFFILLWLISFSLFSFFYEKLYEKRYPSLHSFFFVRSGLFLPPFTRWVLRFFFFFFNILRLFL